MEKFKEQKELAGQILQTEAKLLLRLSFMSPYNCLLNKKNFYLRREKGCISYNQNNCKKEYQKSPDAR